MFKRRQIAYVCLVAVLALGVEESFADSSNMDPFGGATGISSSEEVAPSDVGVMQSAIQNYLSIRDPFVHPEVAEKVLGEKPLLQQISLQQLRLVGILTGLGQVSAMLIDPSGNTFIVREGTKVGQKNGEIVKIDKESLLVREKVVNLIGQEENVDKRITIQANKKDKKAIIVEPAENENNPNQ